MAGSSLFENEKAAEASGLYYSNARWYDPTLGRFITEDPARDGANWYAYCNNNPLAFTDPTGLDVANPGRNDFGLLREELQSNSSLLETLSEIPVLEFRAGLIIEAGVSIPGIVHAKAVVDFGSTGGKFENGQTTPSVKKGVELAVGVGPKDVASVAMSFKAETSIKTEGATVLDLYQESGCNSALEMESKPTAKTEIHFFSFKTGTDTSGQVSNKLEVSGGVGLKITAGIDLTKVEEFAVQAGRDLWNWIFPNP